MRIKTIILLLVVIMLICLLFSINSDDMSITLDTKNAPILESMQNQNLPVNTGKKSIITLYYTDWCGACKMYKPEWIRLQNIINKNYPNITTAEFNCELNGEKCFEKKISGYPTITITKNDNEYFYETSRRSEDIIKSALS